MCIYINIYAYIHTYIQTYIHTYIHTNIHTYIHTYMVLSLMAGWGWQLSAISEVRKPNSIQVNRDCNVYILK